MDHEDEEVIPRDTYFGIEVEDENEDDSDYEEGNEEEVAEEESGSGEDEDDSDYAEDENEGAEGKSGSSGSESSQSRGSGEEDGDSESNDSSGGIGQAPFTGYIFPAVHKLVASGNLEGLSAYLGEMFNPEQAGPQVWEVSDSLGRNAIHLAILHNNLEVLSMLLNYDLKLLSAKYAAVEDPEERYKYSAIRRKFDDMGVIHLGMCNGPWDEATSERILELLYTHPAIEQVSVTDYWKRTPLHIAAMTGKGNLVKFVFRRHPEWLFQKDSFEMLPLHYAIDTKNAEILQLLLSLAPLGEEVLGSLPPDRHPITHAVAKCSWECLVHVCRYFGTSFPARAIEVAEQLGIEVAGLNDVALNLEAAQKCVYDRSRDSAIVYDLDCLGHVRLPTEAEDGHLRLKRIKFVVENPNRLEVLIGRFGSLKTTEFQHLRIIDSVAPCPLTDVVRVHDWSYVRRIIQTAQSVPPGQMARLDKGDTNVSSESWAAALKASGAVIQAMDLVCSETCKNAFVAVRPPGHHVSSRGAVDPNMEDDDTGSNGFCLLNNVAVGAAYALCVHRHVIGKVAIIDFDIHHGNGTEAIVRGLAAPKTTTIPINFTGLTGELQTHSFHPWLDGAADADKVFFASVHRFDGRFYPQSGQTGMEGNIVNVGLESFSASADFRTAFAQLVLPALVQFSPDLILISAGFDGHIRDRLASGEWDITEEDYYWVTEQLVAVANMWAKGRIVSVLEGGYNTRAGWLSPLAQCVASHVRALSSSWASKLTPPQEENDHDDEEDEEEEENESDASHSHVVSSDSRPHHATGLLLAKADAVLDDVSIPSPSSSPKRARLNEEFQLFGEM